MWARKLQELTDMGVIPDYRSAAAHASREGARFLILPCPCRDPRPTLTLTNAPRGPSVRNLYACAK